MAKDIIIAKNLKKWFPLRTGLLSSILKKEQFFVHAVDGISFNIKKGEIFALAGESGSGKTTTGRLLVRLIEPTDGVIIYDGKDITKLSQKEFMPYRKKLQIIFQDPYESLNPRMLIYDIIAEPLTIHGFSEKEKEERVFKALEDVRLVPPQEFIFRFPHELSGGQRQRVAIARALVLNPEFIVADEPVSMLDVSIRAEILNLMFELKEKYGMTILYITHDLALARHICDSIAIMYLGKIMEMGSVDEVINEPLHPYTEALIEAVPVPDPEASRIETVLKGEIPSPVNPPSGCRFHTRCPKYIGDICKAKEPKLTEISKGRYVACHLYSSK
ncbi:oligopeptide ABC transporter ATP-binding protein [Candidatus Bathyarchaeota archaeon]|nr:MAG: oligopeptide ABC transporter ATP-binding protein [Candidatus Bathyarchaeota archaeon]